MHSQFTSSLMLAVVVAVSVCVSGLSDNELFKQHKINNRRLTCGPPQPRVFALEDILAEDQLPSSCETILPNVSVLHVCDYSSGCCDNSKSCQPIQVEDVILVYQILSQHSKNPSSPCFNETKRKRYIHVQATNHTMCSCRHTLNQPK